jgi:hypothetical protein
VIIEQPGAWGAKALQDADLPAGVGPAIAEAAGQAGVGVLLARHPDHTVRGASYRASTHRIWAANVQPGREELRRGATDNLREILSWDFAEIADGILPALNGPCEDPLLLVCTQGGRDACCARIGRPLVVDLLAASDDAGREQTWEASHIGGHRFAPTLLVLPTGAVYGRLDAAQAHRVLEATARGEILVPGLRGRSGLSPCNQVADVTVRELTGEQSARAFEFAEEHGQEGTVRLEARHRDGRAWKVSLRQEPLAGPRPESCGAAPRDGMTWRVLAITPC